MLSTTLAFRTSLGICELKGQRSTCMSNSRLLASLLTKGPSPSDSWKSYLLEPRVNLLFPLNLGKLSCDQGPLSSLSKHNITLAYFPCRIFKPNSHSPPVTTTMSSTTASTGRAGRTKWIQVDVKAALLKWMSDKAFGSSKKIMLMIEAVDSKGHLSKDVVIEADSVTNVSECPLN